jgi:hypothetical protein
MMEVLARVSAVEIFYHFFNLHFLLFQGEYQIIIRVVNEDNKNELACFQSTFEIKKRQSKSKKRRRKNER